MANLMNETTLVIDNNTDTETLLPYLSNFLNFI